MEPLLGDDVIFHYQAFQTGDTVAKMALESPHQDGWAALGFGDTMVGSTAIIATTKAANGIGVFLLGGFSPDQITEYPDGVSGSGGSRRRLSDASPEFTISDASIERTDGRLVARFSRAYDDSFRGDATIAAIAAYHSSDAALAQTHEQRTKGLGLSLTGGAITVAEDNIPKLRQWHAGLMLLSWGVLLPLGAIMAATLKTFGPKSMWFQLHRATQTLGLLLATVGFFLAVAKFDSLPSGDSHKRFGIVVMVLGWLQPINALVRPHPPESGEKPTVLRRVWEFVHHVVGWVCVGLAVSTIVQGLSHAKTYEGLSDNYLKLRNGYIVVGVLLAVLLAVMLTLHIVRTRKQCRDNRDTSGDYVKSTAPGAEGVADVDSVQPPDSP